MYNPHEQSTFSQHYNTSTQNSMMQKSSIMMVYGKGDQERVTKELEKQARVERIKAVRMQESTAAQSTVQGYHEKMKAIREEEERQKQLVLYHQKLEEIEKLRKLKEE